MFDMGKILKLSDGNEYVIVANAQKNGKNYYYLVDQNNMLNVKFLVEKHINGETYLDEIQKSDSLKDVFAIMLENAKKFFKK